MAVGDYVTVSVAAGGGATFSYTAAAGVNILFTNFAGSSWNQIHFDSWVIGVTGNYGWALEADVNGGAIPGKILLLENQTINAAINNNYGILLTGVEV